MSTNAGNVVGLLKSPTPPAKNYLLWAKQLDPTNNPDSCELRVFNAVSGQWELLLAAATVTDAAAIHVKLLGITEQLGGRGPGDFEGSLLDLLRAMFIRPVAIVLTTPATTVNVGDSITISASVADPQNLLDHIAIFDGPTYIGPIQGNNGSLVIQGITLGSHRFTGQVTDKKGFTGPNSGLLIVTAGNAAGGATNPDGSVTIDRYTLTADLMNAVIALVFTGCDAAPSQSPVGSYPGQEFDALDPTDGRNKRYYCSRDTYRPGNSANPGGAGPAWHCVAKTA